MGHDSPRPRGATRRRVVDVGRRWVVPVLLFFVVGWAIFAAFSSDLVASQWVGVSRTGLGTIAFVHWLLLFVSHIFVDVRLRSLSESVYGLVREFDGGQVTTAARIEVADFTDGRMRTAVELLRCSHPRVRLVSSDGQHVAGIVPGFVPVEFSVRLDGVREREAVVAVRADAPRWATYVGLDYVPITITVLLIEGLWGGLPILHAPRLVPFRWILMQRALERERWIASASALNRAMVGSGHPIGPARP